MPQNLRGYALWLEGYWGERWQCVCELRPTAARNVLAYLYEHPHCRMLRVRAEKV